MPYRTIFLALSLLLSTANAATYYISWLSGNDANDGLTPETAWKRGPRMKGYTGSHPIPQPGDRFIFKGGETWPKEALKLRLTNSGTFASPIVYSVDTSWYTGESWTRPIFDCENTVITDSGGTPQTGSLAAALLFDSTAQAGGTCRNIVVEYIEIRNHRGHIVNEGSYGSSTVSFNSGSVANSISNIVLRGMVIRDWSLRRYSNGDDTGDAGGVTCVQGVPPYVTIDACKFFLSDPDAHSGSAVKSFNSSTFTFIHNEVHDLSGGLVTVGGVIVSNFFYNIAVNSCAGCAPDLRGNQDDLAHENVLYDFGRGTIVTHNTFSNCAPPFWYEGPSSYSGSTPYNTNTGVGMTLIANNLMLRTGGTGSTWLGTRACINIDNETIGHSSTTGWPACGIRIVNNTAYLNDGGPFVRWDSNRGTTYKLGFLDIGNNYIVTNQPPSAVYIIYQDALLSGPNYYSNVIHSLSTATGHGMTLANGFRPQASGTPIDGVAVDFRAIWPNLTTDIYGTTRDAAPDVGAYEFAESPPEPPGTVIRVTRFRVGQLLSRP